MTAAAKKAPRPSTSPRPKKPRPPLRAFAATENCESTGGVVFAHYNVEARRLAASQFGDGDFSGWTVKQAPWADAYASAGDVPLSVMIRHGWYFECTGCGVRIDEELPDWQNERGHRPYAFWKPEHVLGAQRTAIYCRRSCKNAHDAERAEAKRLGERWLERFRKLVRARFGDVEFTEGSFQQHAYVTHDVRRQRWIVEQLAVSFNFPDQQHGPATLRYDKHAYPRQPINKPHYTCCAGDKKAFETFAAATKPTKKSLPETADVR